ncbi:MAG: hypothetical protein ACRDP6_49445 [Actinoallomurus sp.]
MIHDRKRTVELFEFDYLSRSKGDSRAVRPENIRPSWDGSTRHFPLRPEATAVP